MKAQGFTLTKAGLGGALAPVIAIKPQLAVLFAGPSYWKDDSFFSALVAALPGVSLIGCSSEGTISESLAAEDVCAGVALRFDAAQIKTASAPIPAPEDSYNAGQVIGRTLKGPDLRGIFALAPGLRVQGSALAAAVAETAGVPLAGGLAGDGARFRETHMLLNGKVLGQNVVAFGVYGQKASMTLGCKSGWRPFGPARRATRASGSVLYQLDNKPALQLFRDYLGARADALPASGLQYPLCILREEDRRETGLVRIVTGVDAKEGSVVLSGDIPQGALLRLMHADAAMLAGGAEAAAAEACKGGAGGAAILVSCAGRRAVMDGGDAAAETEAVRRAMGAEGALAGFYSYGGFVPFSGNSAEVTSQSLCVAMFSEGA